MFYQADTRDHGMRYDPFKAIVTPRPIGWIGTKGRDGSLNLSPYSFFNMVAERPQMVAFSSFGHKDAVAFISETREFVCNLATYDLRDAVNATSTPLPRGESELDFAGLTAAPSQLVKPPRVAEAPAALECHWLQTVHLHDLEGAPVDQYLVIGQIVGVYIEDRFIVDGLVDTAAMRPIMRAGYFDYFVATPETKFNIRRPRGGGGQTP